MFGSLRSLIFFSTLAATSFAVAQNPSQNVTTRLDIQAKALPKAMTGQRYSARVSTTGGTGRISWDLVGKLPPGLQLDPRTGEITGVPRAPGEWTFAVQARDENLPAQTVRREMVLLVVPSLLIVWTQYPQVQNDGIFGRVAVS